MYYSVNSDFMQSLIEGIYGREMIAPEEHIRYYNGYFYFVHIGDCEERFWFGYDYTVDSVYHIANEYYKIEGEAILYDYADGNWIETKKYSALVKKDSAATYGYYLLAQAYDDLLKTKGSPDIVGGEWDYIVRWPTLSRIKIEGQ